MLVAALSLGWGPLLARLRGRRWGEVRLGAGPGSEAAGREGMLGWDAAAGWHAAGASDWRVAGSLEFTVEGALTGHEVEG